MFTNHIITQLRCSMLYAHPVPVVACMYVVVVWISAFSTIITTSDVNIRFEKVSFLSQHPKRCAIPALIACVLAYMHHIDCRTGCPQCSHQKLSCKPQLYPCPPPLFRFSPVVLPNSFRSNVNSHQSAGQCNPFTAGRNVGNQPKNFPNQN